MGDLIVVTGPPGAGKSTVAARLADLLEPSALVLGDAFFGFLRNGAVPPWLDTAQPQNMAVVEAAAGASGRLADQCHVVYDGVVGPWILPAFRVAAKVPHLHYAMLLPPLEVCLERIRTRRGHGFSDPDAASHMWREFQRAEVNPRHVITERDTDPGETTQALVERMERGSILYP